jgi:xyloglucan fucosyltransferase
VFQEKQPPQQILDQLLSCVRDEKLLPETTTKDDNGTSSSYSVLVTSLSSWYYERLKGEYGDTKLVNQSRDSQW